MQGNVLFMSVTIMLILNDCVVGNCGLTFEKMKDRRLNAIKGQILSKLGFNKLPRSAPRDPPREDEIKLYNITRDFVNEQARKKQGNCEMSDDDWFAQDITTVYSNIPEDHNDYEDDNENQAEYFHFDLSSYEFEAEQVVSATLRLHQVRKEGESQNTEVILNEILSANEENILEKRTLHAFTVNLQREGWLSLDVTETIKRWIRYPDQNQGLEMTLPCIDHYGFTNTTLKTNIEGSIKKSPRRKRHPSRGDVHVRSVPDEEDLNENKMNFPHIIIMTRATSAEDNKNSRHKRSISKPRRLDAEYCFRQYPDQLTCCLRELFIDFKRDLNWNWVVSPTGYKANFCAGTCPYMYSGDTMHYNILYMHRINNPNASPTPCCTPKEYAPLTLMYHKDGKYRIRQLPDLLVVSCRCG